MLNTLIKEGKNIIYPDTCTDSTESKSVREPIILDTPSYTPFIYLHYHIYTYLHPVIHVYTTICTHLTNNALLNQPMKQVLNALKKNGYSVVIAFIYASKANCLHRGSG